MLRITFCFGTTQQRSVGSVGRMLPVNCDTIMAKHISDEYREKFRPDNDPALDRELEKMLEGVSEEELYAPDRQQLASETGRGGDKQARRGKIVQIDKDDLFVDFGGKSQGIISRMQFVGTEEPVVGQEMDFIVDRYDAREGLLILSRRGATAQHVTWENLEVGQIVEGTVNGSNKGGLELDIKGMRAFMPAGQVEMFHVPDFAQYIGQKMTAEVTQFDPQARNLVLSRRNILEREREKTKEKLLAELAEGQIRRGTVQSVMDFGAFIDLGGVTGLLHVSELSFKRGRHAATEFVKIGDQVDVKILKIDRESGKISLSLKQARGVDPWADAVNKYAVGSSITGRVTRVEQFGAFIEVEEGIEGLLPISEMSWKRIGHPSDLVKEGDTLKLVVLSVDPVARRLSFSLKQAGPDPWSKVHERYALETNVPGKITRVVDFGAFVELELGLEGLVHLTELSGGDVRSAARVVKPGQDVRVRILEIDQENRRISLSLKRATETEAATGAASPAPQKKKKGPPLRGGLDF
jgi:small subunit ribosomal protein S1